MTYNNFHGILNKNQVHNVDGVIKAENTYNSTYNYLPNTHRIGNIVYGTTTDIFAYDANGNQLITDRKIGTVTTNVEKMMWDENNRMKGFMSEPDVADLQS